MILLLSFLFFYFHRFLRFLSQILTDVEGHPSICSQPTFFLRSGQPDGGGRRPEMDLQEMHAGEQRPVSGLRGVLRLQTPLRHPQQRHDLEKRRILVLLQVHPEERAVRDLLPGVQDGKGQIGNRDAVEEPLAQARRLEEAAREELRRYQS